MLQPHRAAEAPIPPRDLASTIQFYSIELMAMAEGGVYVGVTATVCEREGELDLMDMAKCRVDSIDAALTVIREAFTLPN